MNYLIPLSYINEATGESQNVDEKKMKGALEEAQEDLRDLIGTEFYDQIDSQYIGNTLSAANDTLYEDYLKKFLAWQSSFYYLGFSQSLSTPTGQRQFTDENSTILEDVKLFAYEKNVRRRAMKYKFQIVNYIDLQQSILSTNFPLYEAQCREEMSFAITAVSHGGNKNAIISVNRAIKNNE